LPSGKQDEYGSAMGGLNQIVFAADSTTVTPVNIPPETLATLQRRIMLFYTGKSRDSEKILRSQSNASREHNQTTLERMHRIKALGQDILAAIEAGKLDDFGDLLHQSWVQKRGVTSDITNDAIDHAYDTARAAGALGGKITGAGGGGFLMLYCREDKQDDVTRILRGLHLHRMDFCFDFDGAQVLLRDNQMQGLRV
jgi:D-glycero-alpha-D-manno-heptose-7-phosphate kinase